LEVVEEGQMEEDKEREDEDKDDNEGSQLREGEKEEEEEEESGGEGKEDGKHHAKEDRKKEGMLELVKERLNNMHIPLGTNLIELISVLRISIKRRGVKGVWAGIVKLHLLNPQTNGVALLTGLRPFILHLEPYSNVGSLGKVCKSYHSIASSNNLYIQISNDALIGLSSHAHFLDVLENNFRRGHNFEIVEVQKSTTNNHAYIVAPTPLQAKKIQTFK
jgi:hypothetical protein